MFIRVCKPKSGMQTLIYRTRFIGSTPGEWFIATEPCSSGNIYLPCILSYFAV